MIKNTLFFIVMILALSCQNSENIEPMQDCEFSFEITAPNGFEINLLETIEYNGNLIEIQSVDGMTGYILGSNNVGGCADIFKTIDGGNTWDNMELIPREVPRSMFFLNDSIGFITLYGSNGNLLKTTDGGENWGELFYNDLTGVMYHIQKDKYNNIYSITTDTDFSPLLLKSSDKAKTWQVISDSPDFGFDLVTFSFKVDEENIYISGKNEEILITDLEGNLEKKIQTGISSIRDFGITNSENIIVTGSSKTIKSSDGGKNWINIYDRSARLIDFKNSNEILMILI
ncbi:MAG: YCF48-related protein [Bacteroidales bacterium]